MRSTSLPINPLVLFFLPLALGLGLFLDSLETKFLAMGALAIGAYGVLLLPIKWSLVLLMLYVGFEGFLKIISNFHPVVHVGADLMVIVLCAKVIWRTFFDSVEVKKFPPLTRLFAVHFAWLLVIMFNPYAMSLVSSIAGAKVYVTMILLYFFGYYLVESRRDIYLFMGTALFIAFVHTLFGLYQGYAGPASVIAIHPRYGVQLEKYAGFAFRPFGLSHVPGAPSIYIHVSSAFVWYFLYLSRNWWVRFGLLAYLPAAINLLLLCQVRSAILKAMISGGVFLLGSLVVAGQTSMRATRYLVLLTLGLVTVTLLVLPEFINYSTTVVEDNERAIERSMTVFDYEMMKRARKNTLGRFLKYAQEVPLGAGFARIGAAAGAFKEDQQRDPYFGFGYFFADNFWIASLVEIGIPGMIFMTVILLGILYFGYRNFWKIRSPNLRIINVGIWGMLLSIFLGLYGAEGVLYNPEALYFWFFSGIMMKLPDIDQGESDENKLA